MFSLAWLLLDLRVSLGILLISFGWLVSTVKNEVRLGVGCDKIYQGCCQCCCYSSGKEEEACCKAFTRYSFIQSIVNKFY